MHHSKLRIAAGIVLTAIAQLSFGQAAPVATSESRDASVAYIGSFNFVVGRIGRDCLSLLGRTESPQEFVGAWQQRNMKYLAASQKYMDARLAETEATGGVEKRNAVIRELTDTVRTSGEASVKAMLDRADKKEACKRVVGLIDSGAYDVSPKSPMFAELESLAAWASQK